jgi:hypothetical protein
MEWLTPEQAVERAHLKKSPQTLSSYPNRSQQKITTEERFQKLGLLFDRDRWKAGEPYLALLKNDLEPAASHEEAGESVTLETSSGESSDSNDFDNQTNTSESKDVPNSEQPEPYVFEECTVKLTITFLPNDGAPLGREVILAASSHGDFPVNKILREQELGYLPQPVQDLLEELKADFPNRQVRRTLMDAKAEKKGKKKSPAPVQFSQSNSTKTKEENRSSSGTQLTLSFLRN